MSLHPLPASQPSMSAAEHAAFLPVQVYLIQGERKIGEHEDPPRLRIEEVSEIRAVDAYLMKCGRRRIHTFEREGGR